MSDPLIELLVDLPLAEPDAARAERVRTNCRAQLERRALRASVRRGRVFRGRAVQVWQPLITVLGIVYMTQVIIQALGVYGFQ